MNLDTAFDPIQDSLADIALIAFSFVLIPVLALLLIRVRTYGWQPLNYFQIMALLLIWGMAALNRKIAVSVKSIFLIIIFFLLGCGAFLTWGLSGFGLPLLFIGMIFSTIFYGIKVGVMTNVAGTVFILLTGIGVKNGYVHYNVDLGTYTYNFYNWLTIGFGYFFITMIPIVVLDRLYRILVSKVHEAEDTTKELQHALAKVKTLSGLLPICSNCKQIRDDQGYWNKIEIYIKDHSDADFTHSICPECAKELYPELYEDK
ncbi:hypothetical protein ACFL43_06720 [Thermodesulfobacteriota bacterium]